MPFREITAQVDGRSVPVEIAYGSRRSDSPKEPPDSPNPGLPHQELDKRDGEASDKAGEPYEAGEFLDGSVRKWIESGDTNLDTGDDGSPAGASPSGIDFPLPTPNPPFENYLGDVTRKIKGGTERGYNVEILKVVIKGRVVWRFYFHHRVFDGNWVKDTWVEAFTFVFLCTVHYRLVRVVRKRLQRSSVRTWSHDDRVELRSHFLYYWWPRLGIAPGEVPSAESQLPAAIPTRPKGKRGEQHEPPKEVSFRGPGALFTEDSSNDFRYDVMSALGGFEEIAQRVPHSVDASWAQASIDSVGEYLTPPTILVVPSGPVRLSGGMGAGPFSPFVPVADTMATFYIDAARGMYESAEPGLGGGSSIVSGWRRH